MQSWICSFKLGESFFNLLNPEIKIVFKCACTDNEHDNIYGNAVPWKFSLKTHQFNEHIFSHIQNDM